MSRIFVLFFVVFWLAACTAPKALTSADLQSRIEGFQAHWQEGKERLSKPMTLADALVYSLNHNLKFRLQTFKAAMATGNRHLADISMLPSLTAKAGYSKRNNLLASTSRSVATGFVSLVPSTSSDKSNKTWRLQANWNLLDFAMGWLDARRFGEQALRASEEYRRVAYQQVIAVVSAWDQAYALQKVEPRLKDIKKQVSQALKQSRALQQAGLRDQVKLIEYRKSMLLILQRVNQLHDTLNKAKDHLAQLLGLPAGIHIDMQSLPAGYGMLRQGFTDKLKVWQWAALLNRPELRAAIYKQRALDHQTMAKLVSLFPSILLGFGIHHDSNSFLINDSWHTTSASLALDIMKLARLPSQHHVGKLNKQIARAHVQLQATAVMAQVSMADKAWRMAQANSCINTSLSNLDRKKLNILKARVSASTGDQLSMVKARLDALLMRLQSLMAQANLRHASLLLAQSVGVGALPNGNLGDTPAEKAASISRWLQLGMQKQLEAVFDQAQKAMEKNTGDNNQSADKTLISTKHPGEGKESSPGAGKQQDDGMVPLDLQAIEVAKESQAPDMTPTKQQADQMQQVRDAQGPVKNIPQSCVFAF